MSALPLWLEIHVDDLALQRDPSRWDDTAALITRVARVAEEAGARLSFRFREFFARDDRDGIIRGLVARGHEAGWHAHGKRLEPARDAVVAAGGTAAVTAPGLVQARDPEGVLETAKALGCRRVTDRTEARRFAYQGWLAWEPSRGLVSMDVSVAPWQWGVCDRKGRPGRPDFVELARRVEIASGWVVPTGATAFFGATLHEHDVHDFDALARFLVRYGPRIVPSASIPYAPVSEPRTVGPSRVATRVRSFLLRAAPPHLPIRDLSLRVAPGSSRTVAARRIGPERVRGAVVLVHGGASGISQGLGFVGLRDDSFPRLALWSFARSEGPRAPGNAAHRADTRAVFEAALAEGVPVGVLTWSAGIVPALAAWDERLRFLYDAEGPVDRFCIARKELADVDLFDDAAWTGKEALALPLPARYRRLQAEVDHVHGRILWHARRIAPDVEVLPGVLSSHGERVRAWIEAEF